MDLERLTKLITFISESYVFGMKALGSEKLKKKRITISREHLNSLLEAMREMIDNLEMMTDVSEYSLRMKMLEYILEAYDSLAKAIKHYHYVKRAELAEKGEDIDYYLERLADEDFSEESSEEEKGKQKKG